MHVATSSGISRSQKWKKGKFAKTFSFESSGKNDIHFLALFVELSENKARILVEIQQILRRKKVFLLRKISADLAYFNELQEKKKFCKEALVQSYKEAICSDGIFMPFIKIN